MDSVDATAETTERGGAAAAGHWLRAWDERAGRIGQGCAQHARGMMAGILAAGIICRLVQYFWRISFWGDEAYLVLNVRAKSGWGLLGPLDAVSYAPQSSPPLFLLLSKWITRSSPAGELEYRLVPLICSIAALVLFAWLAWKLFRPGTALLASAMLALSWGQLDHAAEFKQYSGDACVAVVLLALALGVWQQRPWWARLLLVAVAAAGLMWFSVPAVFMFAGISLAFLLQEKWRWGRTSLWSLICLIPVLSFAALYLLSIRHQQNPWLYEYWADNLFDARQWWAWPWWALGRLRHVANCACEPLGHFTLVCGAAGAWSLWRGGGAGNGAGMQARGRLAAGAMALPILVTLAAATAGQYPIGRRITTFLTPGFLLLAAYGIAEVDRRLGRHPTWRGAFRLLPAAIVGCMVVPAAYYLLVPRNQGHIRPAAEYLERVWDGKEAVYVVGGGRAPFLVYWPYSQERLRLSPQLNASPGEESFWLIYSFAPEQKNKRREVTEKADAVAERIEQYEGSGGMAVHYRRREAAPASQ